MEIANSEAEITRLVPEADKSGSNVALGVVGAILFWPALFAMDFSDADQIELDALRKRYNNLVLVATEKRCGFKSTPLPEIQRQAQAYANACDDDEYSTDDCAGPQKRKYTAVPSPRQYSPAPQQQYAPVPQQQYAPAPQRQQYAPVPQQQYAPSHMSSVQPQSIPQRQAGMKQTNGTGFLIAESNYVLTNSHLLRGMNSFSVKFVNGETINAEIVSQDKQNDIAFLKLERSPNLRLANISIGDSAKMRLGEKVFTIGYPLSPILGVNPKYSEGVINGLTGINDDPRLFQVSLPIQPGNSGGPLFNQEGKVVGITTSTLDSGKMQSFSGTSPQNVNYAIKSAFINNLIPTVPESLVSNTNVVVVQKDSSNSVPDFIENVQNNVVIIQAR
jgi:S1-C subfamily serine protease